MVAGCLGVVSRRHGRGAPHAGWQEQYRADPKTGQAPRSRRFTQAVLEMPGPNPSARPASPAIQVSFLIDTDLLSLLERTQVPPKLANWVKNNEADLFLSVVSFAELQFGLDHAPVTHQASLAAWLANMRRQLAPATEELTEPVLVRWKELLAELKSKNRTMTCEDSLIAATALLHGHTLATHNKRHFEPAGVPLVDPLA